MGKEQALALGLAPRRYLARLSSRCGAAVITGYVLQGAARDWANAGVAIPGWAVGVMLLAFVTAVALAAAMWFVPATVIDSDGIHRRFGRPRDVAWTDVVDLTVVRMWWYFGRVTAQVQGGKTIRLDGVPPDAVPQHPCVRPRGDGRTERVSSDR